MDGRAITKTKSMGIYLHHEITEIQGDSWTQIPVNFPLSEGICLLMCRKTLLLLGKIANWSDALGFQHRTDECWWWASMYLGKSVTNAILYLSCVSQQT